MSPTLGSVTFDRGYRPVMPESSGAGIEYSEKTAGMIDREVRRIIDEAYDRVIHMLTVRKATLEHVVSFLLEHEVIEGDDLRRMIKEIEEGESATTEGSGAVPKGPSHRRNNETITQ